MLSDKVRHPSAASFNIADMANYLEFVSYHYSTWRHSHNKMWRIVINESKNNCNFFIFELGSLFTCSSLRSPKAIPPDMRTVAVSGTRNTFQPRLSKKVASWAWPVVLPPQGPPVRTSWGRGP